MPRNDSRGSLVLWALHLALVENYIISGNQGYNASNDVLVLFTLVLNQDWTVSRLDYLWHYCCYRLASLLLSIICYEELILVTRAFDNIFSHWDIQLCIFCPTFVYILFYTCDFADKFLSIRRESNKP